jgi:hypothetical protein
MSYKEKHPRQMKPGTQFSQMLQSEPPLPCQEHGDRALRTELRNQIPLRKILLFNEEPHHGNRVRSRNGIMLA